MEMKANEMKRYRFPPCLLLVILSMTAAVAAFAQAQTAPAAAQSQEERLEQDFTDPLTTLPQIVIRDSYTPTNFGTDLEPINS